MTPLNYTLSLHAMTIEKLEFLLPAVFTIGPEDNIVSLQKYAKLLSNTSIAQAGSNNSVEELVRGIVEGETRVM
jgi:flotillin